MNRWYIIALCLLAASVPPRIFAADLAGELALAHGMVTAYTDGGTARVVGRGAPVFVGEVVSTATRSIAQLKLNDGTRITLRPSTTFQITAFSTEEKKESALFTLFKGGLRSVSGFLSKRNPNAVRLKTSVATIGIRGTVYDVRLCEADCAAEAALRPEPAGRVGFLKGRVLARASGGTARFLKAGAPVYVGDTLITEPKAFTVIRFRDDSRVTLLANTEFQVEELKFEPDKPDLGTAAFRLVRGGLRALSGLIGKRGGAGYRMRTSVATIGIRGTGYDALCTGTCQNPDAGAGPGGDGLTAGPWQDSIVIDDVHVVETGDIVFIADTGFTPLPVPSFPVPIVEPRPDTVDLPVRPTPPPSSAKPVAGVYLSCHTGDCTMETDDNKIELTNGGAGFVEKNGGEAKGLPEIPPFQAEDEIYRAVELGGSDNRFNQTLDSGVLNCTVR